MKQYCDLKNIVMFAIPNGGKRNKITAKLMKDEGVMAGVPDMFFPSARGGWFGLWVELKRVKGGTVSNAQKEVMALLRSRNYKCIVCNGADEAIKAIDEYMKWKAT